MRWGAATLMALVVGGCAGPRPDPPASATPVVPDAWRDKIASDENVPESWWDAFEDPVLTQVVQRTLSGSDDIAIAVSRVAEARAAYRVAQSQQVPQVDAILGGGEQRALDAFGHGLTQAVGQGQLAIAYDTDLFGRLSQSSSAARAILLSTQAARDSVRLAQAAAAASGYINLRALDARLALLTATVDARRAMLRLVIRRAEAGYAPELDRQQAEADLQGAAALIPPIQAAIRRQEDGLSLLMGIVPSALPRGKALDAIAAPSASVAIPSVVTRRRPDIAQAEQALVAADRSLDSARAAFMPSLRLSASGGAIAATRLPDPVTIFSVGGGILAPLFSGGRLRAQADAAAARRDQAAFAYRRVTLNAFREVEDALAGIDRTAAQEMALTTQRAALVRAFSLATNRYRAGYSPYLEPLDAQRALLTVELALVQARADRLLAHVQLFQALGGGWKQQSQ